MIALQEGYSDERRMELEKAIELGKEWRGYAGTIGSVNFIEECIQASEKRLRELEQKSPQNNSGEKLK